MRLFFGGGFGTDAGGWYIGPDGKIHRVPGWNPEAVLDLGHMVTAILEIGQLKNHALVDQTLRGGILDAAFKEIGTHLKDGGVLVLR